MVYVVVAMTALLGFASLAVDLGHVYVVRSELQLAADAAARYGAAGLETGVAAAVARAVDAADDNTSDGMPVKIDPAADVELGLWNKQTRTFTPLLGDARAAADAVRVTARRTAANGGGVQLLFARVLGKTSQDVLARSVARLERRPASGIIGLDGITFKNNTFVGGYNAASDRNPTEATATALGGLASNGPIVGGINNTISGGVLLGPSAPNVTGMSVSVPVDRLSAPLEAPPLPAWDPAPNPNGLPQVYSASGNVTLPGGTYWFTSLSVRGNLRFAGPATLVVNGPVLVSGSMYAYDTLPTNLKVYQLGSHEFGDDDINGVDVVADILAPQADFLARNNLRFRGRMVMRSITLLNNADIFYDVTLGNPGGGGPRVTTVR